MSVLGLQPRASGTAGPVDSTTACWVSAMAADDSPPTLSLLAAHAAGDFPLQTDRMAAEKFDSRRVRAAHVAVYTLGFVPAVLASDWTVRQSVAFLATIASTHYAVDSRRWNDAVPIWYDQALHVIALALAAFFADNS